MKLFTVYAPPEADRTPEEQAVRMAFVKEGFSWPALFFPLPWLLWHRLWLVLVGWLVIAAAITVIPLHVPTAQALAVPVALLFALWFAFEANGLRRWTLTRRGWRFVGLATGRSRFECELSFFERWLAAAPRGGALRPSAPAASRRPPGDDEVIGLFPRSG